MSLASAATKLVSCGGRRSILLRGASAISSGRGLSTEADAEAVEENRVKSAHQGRF